MSVRVWDGLKLMTCMSRRHDHDLAAFTAHWATIHARHALKLVAPGLMRGYVQNHRLPGTIEGMRLAGDGVPEVWIDDLAAALRLPQSDEYRTGARDDELTFMDGRSLPMIAVEHVIDEGCGRSVAAGHVKAMLFVHRAQGLSIAEFAAAWASLPHPVFLPGRSPLRLTRHICLHDAPTKPYFDGVEFSWWPDRASFEIAWSDRDADAARRLINPEASAAMLAREKILLRPPAHAGQQPAPDR